MAIKINNNTIIDDSRNIVNAGVVTATSAVITSEVTLNGQADLRFADSDSSNWVALQAPATVASNVTWSLPDAEGSSGQSLTTNGAGTLSWATPSSLNFATAVTANNTTGTYDFTGIPSTTKRITIMISDLLGGSDPYLVQLGSSGGVVSSGYNSLINRLYATSSGSFLYATGFGFVKYSATYSAGNSGKIELINIDSNIWVAEGGIASTNGSTTHQGSVSSGRLDLGATLTTVRVTSTTAANFTSGTINIAYEG